ncbi:MAG: hypothetical protein RIE56_02005 [Amphiplicatus sp.]
MKYLLLLALGFFAWTANANAQNDRERDIAATTQALQDIHDTITDDQRDDVEALEERLRDLRDASRRRLNPVRRDISRAEMDRSALGPAPGENDPPESEALAQRRADANTRVASLRSQDIQISANIAEATELLTQLSTRRVGALYRRAMERGEALSSLTLWREGLTAAGEDSSKNGA